MWRGHGFSPAKDCTNLVRWSTDVGGRAPLPPPSVPSLVFPKVLLLRGGVGGGLDLQPCNNISAFALLGELCRFNKNKDALHAAKGGSAPP